MNMVTTVTIAGIVCLVKNINHVTKTELKVIFNLKLKAINPVLNVNHSPLAFTLTPKHSPQHFNEQNR